MLAHITPTLTREYWQQLADMFHAEHSTVTVKLVDTGSLSVADALKPLIASGNTPDVVYGFPPTKATYQLLLPLTDQPWLKDTLPLPDSWQIDGQQYMANVALQVQSLVFYNKKMFADAGITSPPKSLDELTADMGKLKDAGYIPFQPAGKQLMGGQLRMLSYPTSFGQSSTFFADVNSGKIKITDSGLGKIVRAYADWAEKGYINRNAITTDYAKTQTDFIAGTGAMYPMGSWFAAGVGDKADEFGVFAAPVVDGSVTPPPLAAGNGGWVIFKNTKVKQAALDFVHFITTDPDAVSLQLSADGNFSPKASYDQNSLQKQIQSLLDGATLTDCCNGSGLTNVAPGGLGGELTTIAQDLVGGGSADDAIADLQQFWDQNKATG